MAKFICPNCGNHQLQDQNGSCASGIKSLDVHGKYFCSQCGEELAQEQLKALVVASVQESNALSQLRKQAWQAKDSGNYATASEYYQQMLGIEPNDWEAAFFSVCCNSWGCNIGGIENACTAVKLSLKDVFDKLEASTDIGKKDNVKLVVADACLFAVNKFDAALQYHASLNASVMDQYKGELRNRLISALNVAITCASLVMERFADDPQIAPLVEIPADTALKLPQRAVYVSITLNPETKKTLLEWIGRFNPEYVEEYKKKENRSFAAGTVVLMVLGVICLWLGLKLEGIFAKYFFIPMAVFFLGYGIFRVIVQLLNKNLNG